MAGGALVLAGCGQDDEPKLGTDPSADKPGRERDLEIARYALTLEHLEADFYDAVLSAGAIDDRRLVRVARRIRDEEHEHVEALGAAVRRLGGRPRKPRASFDAVLEDGREKVLETAATLENLAAAAYLGQASRIESNGLLALALSIHSVEGRHAAALNRAAGETIVPQGAFAKPASMREALSQVEPFLAQTP